MRLRSGLLLALSACALLGIFWLPLHIPVRPSGSISYLLGFNNAVALVALGTSLLALGALAAPLLHSFGRTGTETRVPPRTLRRTLVVSSLFCGLMALVASPTWQMDESTYLIGRIKLVLAGHLPYQDFEYIYGPLLLYVPAWTARLFHLGVGPAYFLVWWLEWIAGTTMLAWLIGEIGFPRARARIAFLLFWSAFLSSLINTGETYTPARELAAPVCMAVVHRALRSERHWTAFPVAVVCAAGLFCISPELALAFMAAATLYLALCSLGPDAWWRRTWFWLGSSAMLLGFASCYLVAARSHAFDSARQFGFGGSDIPLLLTPVTLFVVAAFVVATAFCAERLWTRSALDARVAVVLVGLALLPGMAGRADPSHLVLYGMGMLMVALAVAAAASPRVWDLATFLFLLLITAPLVSQKLLIDFLPFFDAGARLLYPHGTVEPGTRGEELARWVAQHKGQAAEARLLREVAMDPADPHRVFPGATPVVMAPFGYTVRGQEKQIRPDVDLGYFDGTVDLMSPVQVARKVAELRSHPDRDLLLPNGFTVATGCLVDPVWAVQLLRLNFGYSYLTEPRHRPDLLEPLCAFIGSHYAPIASSPGDSSYALWRPVPPSAH